MKIRLVAIFVGAVLAPAPIFGCGPNPHLTAADDTLMVTMAAVDETEQVLAAAEADAPGASVRGARQAYRRAQARLDDAEEILRIWRDTGTGELSWVTMSPCLAAALIGLRMSLGAAGLDVPDDLHQAEAMAADPAGDECASEPRPTSGGERPDDEADEVQEREATPNGEPGPVSNEAPASTEGSPSEDADGAGALGEPPR